MKCVNFSFWSCFFRNVAFIYKRGKHTQKWHKTKCKTEKCYFGVNKIFCLTQNHFLRVFIFFWFCLVKWKKKSLGLNLTDLFFQIFQFRHSTKNINYLLCSDCPLSLQSCYNLSSSSEPISLLRGAQVNAFIYSHSRNRLFFPQTVFFLNEN